MTRKELREMRRTLKAGRVRYPMPASEWRTLTRADYVELYRTPMDRVSEMLSQTLQLYDDPPVLTLPSLLDRIEAHAFGDV